MIKAIESNFFNVLITLLIIFVILFIIAFITRWVGQRWPYIKHTILLMFDNSFVVFLIFGVIYIIYYRSSLVDGSLPDDFYFSKNIAASLERLSYIFVSIGAFSAGLKYISSLSVFKKQFKELVLSDEFDSLLTKKLDVLAYSEEHLLRQGDIEEIWERVTLCKYQKQFPNLYDRLKEKLTNHLFSQSNMFFYYKNFKVEYTFELKDPDHAIIKNISNYTIVRPNNESFNYNFGMNLLIEDHERQKTEIEISVTNDAGIKFDLDNIEEEKSGNYITLKMNQDLQGNMEYHIRRKTVSIQNLNLDREYSFGSNRIIDSLDIKVKYYDELTVYFSKVNDNMFINDELENKNEKSYSNRGLILPGEKFKLFIIKNN